MKKYIQKKDKKKECPLCKTFVFNATIICSGIVDNGLRCLFMHRNKNTPEKLREKYNNLMYEEKEKYVQNKKKILAFILINK